MNCLGLRRKKENLKAMVIYRHPMLLLCDSFCLMGKLWVFSQVKITNLIRDLARTGSITPDPEGLPSRKPHHTSYVYIG